MKKILLILICLFILSGVAFSEGIDYASMSFEDLQTIKSAIDKEYFSRPESDGMQLDKGDYTVGKDIKPGRYYVAMLSPTSSNDRSHFCVYDNYETLLKEEPGYSKLAKVSEYIGIFNEAISVSLEENNIVSVVYGRVSLRSSPFLPGEYYTYDAPEGTFVPVGEYIVGKDIPEGNYSAYPGTINGGSYHVEAIKENKEGKSVRSYKTYSTGLYVLKEIGNELIRLAKDDILVVEKPIVMKKTTDFNFD